LLLILYITTYDFRGNLVPNRPNKIPITPKLSTVRLFLHLWKLLEYPGRYSTGIFMKEVLTKQMDERRRKP